MEGFENTMTNSANEVRTRRKRFFCFLLAFMMAVVTPRMDVVAASINMGMIHNAPVTTFNVDAYRNSHLSPGDSITWGIGACVNSGDHISYKVTYKVGDTSYYDNVDINGSLASGGDTVYIVRDLASISGGVDTRTVDYWILDTVWIDNKEVGAIDPAKQVTDIFLTAHFAAPAKKPEVKKVVVVEDEGPKAPPHEHTYTWVKTIETTEDVDGEWSYKCECGDVKYRIPESGAFAFIRNSIDKINKAPNGSTLEIKTSRWLVFTTAVADAISDRPDLTIKLSYLEGGHRGDRLITTLPAGTDLHQYLDEKGYVGFLYLKTIFPTERVAGK